MGLFENLPFTNFDNLNLDMIVKDISTMKGNEEYLKDKVDEMEECCEQVQDNITNIQEDITNIYQQIGDIDIESLEGRVDVLEASDTAQNNEINSIKSRLTTAEGKIATNEEDIEDNDQASRGRDDALSARIRNLEQATIHDIYNYYGSDNLLIFGSDLSYIPSKCKDADGFPFGWGNKYNQRFSIGTETERAWKFTNSGLLPDTNQSAYDYYQCGFYPSIAEASESRPITVTIASSANTFWQHTFTSPTEEWEIGSGCKIKFATDTSNGYSMRTLWLMGTPQSWSAFLYMGPIKFIYVEYGTGSLKIENNRLLIKWDLKDREFFGHDATPTLPEAVITGQVTENATVTYYDLVGDPQTITSQIVMTANLKKYGKMVDGYLVVRMNLNENVGDILARGAQFTLTGLAMTYDGGVNAPMPDLTSPLRGTANDSKYYEWDYNNTQNTYLFVNISDNGTWNLKLLSGGMRNYTGTSTTYTEFRIPIHYIAN